MRLLVLVVLQCAIVIWLHFVALRRNLQGLRVYVAHAAATQPDVWVDGGTSLYSFRLCADCVDAVVLCGDAR